MNGGFIPISKHMKKEFEHIKAKRRREEEHARRFPTKAAKIAEIKADLIKLEDVLS